MRRKYYQDNFKKLKISIIIFFQKHTRKNINFKKYNKLKENSILLQRNIRNKLSKNIFTTRKNEYYKNIIKNYVISKILSTKFKIYFNNLVSKRKEAIKKIQIWYLKCKKYK